MQLTSEDRRRQLPILVAEDDPTSRRLLQALLSRWSYEVEAVPDGTAAWEVLCGPEPPRIAILDWMMPGVDGLELCLRSRKAEREGRQRSYLILLTARGRKEDIVEGLNAGADDYITKPFHHNELRARIGVGRRLVEAWAHIRQLQGILPVCMHCHSIRDDDESWTRLEEYLEEHSEARMSHGICPECLAKHYPGVEDEF